MPSEQEIHDKYYPLLYNIIAHGKEDAEATPDELEFLRWVFEDLSSKDIVDVLDVGCGSGRYLLPMVRGEYRVTGLDSSPHLLQECNRRLRAENLRAPLIQGSMEKIAFNQKYDAVLMMDCVLLYLLDTTHIINTLKRIYRALRPKGVVVIDNRNFLSHMNTLGKEFADSYESDTRKVKFKEISTYDSFRSVITIAVEAQIAEKNETVTVKHSENLRVMTVEELKGYMKEAGFKYISAVCDYDYYGKAIPNSESIIFTGVKG